jgi:hypothetical protein
VPTLTYSGISIDILRTHAAHCEDVYDETGSDYLWTKWTFDITGVINVGATNFTTAQGNPAPVPLATNPPQAGGIPPGAAVNPPFLSHAAIRDTLAQPRQLLTYADEAGNILVESPGLGPAPAANFKPGGGIQNNVLANVRLDCDCTLGPTPLRPVEVLAVHGSGKSVIVRFAVSCTVNESVFWSAQGGLAVLGRAPPKPAIIVSNRWRTTEVLDEAAFSTRTYAGRATFRADLLRDVIIKPTDGSPDRLAVPDDFRAYWGSFFVPPGFQRREVWVQQDPAGLSVDYRITDVQLPVTLKDRRAYKIEATYTTGTTHRGAEVLGIEAERLLANQAVEAAMAASADPFSVAGHLSAAGLRVSRGLWDLGLAALPRSTDRVRIRAYGQPGSNRKDLVRVCYLVLANCLVGGDDIFRSSTSAWLTVDLMGKFASLDFDLERGPVNSVIRVGLGAFGDMRDLIADDDGLLGVSSQTPGTQPVYPNDSNLRGTALEWMVAQSLSQPYRNPDQAGGHSQAGQGVFPP